MKFIKLLTLIVLPSLLMAHGKVADKVIDKQNQLDFPNYSIFNVASESLKDLNIDRTLSDGIILDVNQEVVANLFTANHDALSLTFPTKDGSVKVDLIKNQVLAHDFLLRQSSDKKNPVDYQGGLYYQGIVSGNHHSLVSVSIFEDELMVFVHLEGGKNLVIGKLKGRKKHVAYYDEDLNEDFELDCSTEDDGVGYDKDMLHFDETTRTVGDCIRVYYEIDDDIVSNKGGVTGATNYLTGLMNETITLYANDGITMVISEILAWNTPAPYSGSSSSAMLNSFQANTGSFNGDLSHLVSYQASGGIAAGFSGICNSNVDNSKCFSSIDAFYNIVPAYSYTVMVVTHEMGHLIGSRHTHACVWNGNNTAIDGCAGYVEGGCSLPGSPSNGGTIMSYCHVATGIDFTQGFGPQPRAVLLNTIANSNCTSPCGSGPSCNDGVQNGDETGVDCGGSSCPPCSGGCTDNAVTVSITLDNYPEETSWQITNSNGSVVASGGTYGTQPDGSTVNIDLCLVDDCYDFTINDSYGDGICCNYGSGSYTVSSGGTVLASGGSFQSSETTNFCFGPPAPTCDDGIQNGDETGVDCGGSSCPPCNTGGQILGSYFETGWDSWLDGGSDCFRYSGSYSYEGNYSIRIRDNSGSASAMTSPALNLSGYNSITVKFYFYANSMENGEDFWLRYSSNNGSTWTTVATWARGTSFNNNTFYTAEVTLNASQVNFTQNARIRFQCDASGNQDQIYIDQVTVTASTGNLIEGGEIITSISEIEKEIAAPVLIDNDLEFDVQTDKFVLYPNPALDLLNIQFDGEVSSASLMGMNGQIIKVINTNELQNGLDISSLNPGVYYILIENNGEFTPKKFVKM